MSANCVAVLFARSNSVYKSIPGCDVFDLARDARTYTGTLPVIAHPPCRAFGRLRHFAKPRADERELAHFAVAQVQRCGGVLEHPWASSLWPAAGLPLPGQRDRFGGYTLGLLQGDFGHSAPKATWLYICGIDPADLPVPLFELGEKTGRVELMGKAARESTPPAFAHWLVDLAKRTSPALSFAPVLTGKVPEVSGAVFESGSVCNTRTLCNGLHFSPSGTPRTLSNGLD